MNDEEKLKRARLLRQYELGLEKITDRLRFADPNACSNEDITITLEEVEKAIPKLKEFWDKNLRDDGC